MNAQTTQEALNLALRHLEAWKAAALAAQAERDALAAQITNLLECAADAERWFNKHDPNGYYSPKREHAKKCLAEIKAQAVLSAVADYKREYVGQSIEVWLASYAESIRKGEVK